MFYPRIMCKEIVAGLLFSLMIGSSEVQAAARDPSCTNTTIGSLSCDFNDQANRLCDYINQRMDDGGMEWQGKGNSAHGSDLYAPVGSKARIRAPVPENVNAVCIELTYESLMNPNITVYNELEDGSNEKVIGQIRDPTSGKLSAQFHSCVAKDSYISFEVVKTGIVALVEMDDIKVTRSNMNCPTPPTETERVPKCNNILKTLSCVFSKDFCGFSNKPVSGSTSWVIKDGVAVFGDPMAGARSSAELIAHANDIIVTSICIELSYRTNDNYAFITINNKWSDGSVNKKIGQIIDDTNGEWKVARFEACIGANSYISIEANMNTRLSVLSSQYVKIRQSSTDCSTESGVDRAVIG